MFNNVFNKIYCQSTTIIDTSKSIFEQPSSIVPKIAHCWDKISLAWRKIWGPHIHHGFYEMEDENEMDEPLSPLKAQEKLIEKLASLLDLKPHQKILDVGCGMGGSSFFLAQNYQAELTGITLSQKQLEIANQERDQILKVNPQCMVSFKIEDAHDLKQFSNETFDVVWSLESCEQFFDKQKFINEAYRVLKPGGKLMLATWCSDQEFYKGKHAKTYLKVCQLFDLPYMPSMSHYQTLLEKHFYIQSKLDWSNYVKKSWNIGLEELKKYPISSLFKMAGVFGLKFAFKIKYLKEAFQTGRIQYGVFICQKSEG